MELEPYVSQVQEQLLAAARLGDDRTRETAASLAAAAGPALRLAVLGAVSGAVAEISAQLEGAVANAYLDGDDITVALTRAGVSPDLPLDEGDASARISLRLSESLKAQVEGAARQQAISVNTWLVRAAAAALGNGPGRVPTGNPHHLTGWING